jgi:DNA adenine methylase
MATVQMKKRGDPASLELAPQVSKFPSTRYMGSKERLLQAVWEQAGRFDPTRVLDLCSGSGVVSYMFKAQGCQVFSNDYMAMATTIARALVANNETRLGDGPIEAILNAIDEGDAIRGSTTMIRIQPSSIERAHALESLEAQSGTSRWPLSSGLA